MKTTITLMLALLGAGFTGRAQTAAADCAQAKTDSIMTKTDSTMTKINEIESIANGVQNGYLFIENGIVKGYKTIENGVVKGYKGIEQGAVGGFTKINDAITLKLFGKEGETIEETKARLNANVESREILEKNRKATEERIKKI